MADNRLFILIIVVVLVSLTLATAATSADGIWTTRAEMPTGRWEMSPCVVDGKIYSIGGAGPVFQALNTVEEYDPVKDTWESKTEMPTARQGLSTSVVDGKIYAIGGGSATSQGYSTVETFSVVEEYDPSTNAWTTKTPMPTARGWHSANVVDGKIYIIGGSQNSSPDGNHVLKVEVYDPATDTWTQKGEMPESRGAGYSSVVDGKIYLFGGYGGSQKVVEYDPSTESWTKKSDMPTRRIGLSTTALDGKIYVIGGYIPGLSSYKGITIVEVYDPATDTWTTAPDMPTGRFGAYAGVVDGKIYVIGGMGKWIGEAYGIVEEYSLVGLSEQPTESLNGLKVLVYVRDGSNYPEYMLTNELGIMLSMLEEAGITAVIATQSEDSYQNYEPHLNIDILLQDVNVADYDGFLLPCMAAGKGSNTADDAVAMVAEAAAQNKPVAAQFGSIPTLAKAGLLDGKHYAYDRDVFKEGTYEGFGVVKDGNIITSGTCSQAARYYGRTDGTPELTQKLIEAVSQ